MTIPTPETATGATLAEEIQRYLVVVEAFTALGARPAWASEGYTGDANAERRSSDGQGDRWFPSSGRLGDG